MPRVVSKKSGRGGKWGEEEVRPARDCTLRCRQNSFWPATSSRTRTMVASITKRKKTLFRAPQFSTATPIGGSHGAVVTEGS